MSNRAAGAYARWGKRLIDLGMALLLLLLLSPLLLLVALVIRLTLGAPVLFCQERAGRDGTRFTLYKFRTMTDRRGDDGALLRDAERLTHLGRLLRSSSIDELPELINIVRGEMSLVGPRPLLAEYLDLYTPEQARRHSVTPGITGWTQVNGRNAVSWPEKFRLDLWYCDNMGLALDLRILAMTAVNVLLRRGVTAEDHASMPRFTGEEETKEAQRDG